MTHSIPQNRPQRGLKKIPTQARSRARVEAILDGASQILAEHGYDAMTTTMIAEQASIPVGSLYQYFDSKEDVVAELTNRFEQRVSAFTTGTLTADLLAGDLTEFVAKLVDGLLQLQREDASFVCIFAGSQSDPHFESFTQKLRHLMFAQLNQVMQEGWPHVPEKERVRILKVWTEIARAMIAAIDREEDNGRQETVADLKQVLTMFALSRLSAQNDNGSLIHLNG